MLKRSKYVCVCNKFQDDQMKLNDGPEQQRGGQDKCAIVEGLLRDVWRIEVREIEAMMNIPKGILHEIISGLNLCEVSVCWVLKLLTEEHKSKRKVASLQNLYHYYWEEENPFLESSVMGDETWV